MPHPDSLLQDIVLPARVLLEIFGRQKGGYSSSMEETASNTDEIPMLPFLGMGHLRLKPFADEHHALLAQLEEYDPLRLAASFAGLLTVPALQSNCLRLEILVHLALTHCHGSRKPNDKLVSRLFTALGEGMAGRYEDPSEDVFVTLIRTPRGNFRVLEGIWEAAGFNLQRVISALERVPSGPRFDYIRNSVYALLRLSDIICERAKLKRYELGNAIPESTLGRKHLDSLGSLRRVVRFSQNDLADAGITLDHLAEFFFDPDLRDSLKSEGLGHSSLERYPIAQRNDDILVLLGTYILDSLAVLG